MDRILIQLPEEDRFIECCGRVYEQGFIRVGYTPDESPLFQLKRYSLAVHIDTEGRRTSYSCAAPFPGTTGDGGWHYWQASVQKLN